MTNFPYPEQHNGLNRLTTATTGNRLPTEKTPKTTPYATWFSGNQPEVDLPWTTSATEKPPFQTNFYTTTGKRIFDILFSLLVCVFILSWLYPILGAMILVDSSGPILFVQRRSGRWGKSFPCLKFRTMYHLPQSDFRQATQHDVRVTRLGQFLRRSNLDEMPQFVNVLFGHMSVVGPRPHAVLHDAEYWNLDMYRERYSIRPGLTGLAQARGARGETNHTRKMMQRVRYDHLYMNRQSLWLDVQICWLTARAMLRNNINAW